MGDYLKQKQGGKDGSGSQTPSSLKTASPAPAVAVGGTGEEKVLSDTLNLSERTTPPTWKADPGIEKSGMPLPRTHSRNVCKASLQSSDALPSPGYNVACPSPGSTPPSAVVFSCPEYSGRRRLKLGWQARCSLRAAAEKSCFLEKRRETAAWTDGRDAMSHEAQSWRERGVRE